MNQLTSPIYAALVYELNSRYPIYNDLINKKKSVSEQLGKGGFFNKTLALLIKNGSCPFDSLIKDDLLNVGLLLYGSKKNTLKIQMEEEGLEKDHKGITSQYCIEGFPEDFLENFFKDPLKNLHHRIYDRSHSSFHFLKNKYIIRDYSPLFHSTSKFKKAIAEYFSKYQQSAIPIEVNMCSDIFQHDLAVQRYLTRHIKLLKKMKGNTHSILIYGQRWRNGKVQYKIRNSWGVDYQYVNTHHVFEKDAYGDVWVDGQFLLENTIGLTFVKKKNKDQ
jgi:hypothetical protein